MPQARSRSRGRRALIWTASIMVGVGILLLAALLLATGPAFPWALRTALSLGATSEGLAGDAKVEGSLWRGFSVSDLAFAADRESESLLRRIELESLRLDYRTLPLLLRGGDFDWLDALEVRGLSLALDLPEPEATRPQSRWSEWRRAAPAADFSPLWALLDSRIDLSGIDLDLRQGEQRWRVEGLDLRHGATDRDGTATGELKVAALHLPGAEAPVAVSAAIRRSEGQLAFEEILIGERGELTSLSFAETSPGAWEAAVRIEAGGASVHVSAATAGHVLVELPRGNVLDLASLAPEDADFPLAGTVSDLHFALDGDFSDPSSWETRGRLVASGLRWGNLEFDTLALVLRENTLVAELLSPFARFEGRAQFLLDELAVSHDEPDGVPDWSTLAVEAEAELVIVSLAGMIDSLLPEPPRASETAASSEPAHDRFSLLGESLTGGVSARLEGFRWQGGRPRSGRLEAFGEGLAWEGAALQGVELAADFGGDRVEIALRTALDDASSLDALASIDPETFDFRAEARARLGLDPAASRVVEEGDAPAVELGAVAALAERYAGAGLGGSGTLEWRGSGSLREPTLEGAGELAFERLRFSGGLPFALIGHFAHDRDGFAAPEIAFRSESLALSGSLRAAAGRLELEGWQLEQGGETRLNLDASLPLPAESDPSDPSDPTEPLPDSHELPISLRLALEQLDLANLLAHAMASAPLHGTLSGEADVDGSLDDATAKATLVFRPDETLAGELSGEDAAFALDLLLSGAPGRPESWQGGIEAVLDGLRWGELQLGAVELSVEAGPGAIADSTGQRLLASLVAEQSGARLEARGELGLDGAQTLASLAERPIALDAALEAPDLEALWSELAPEAWRTVPLAGRLDFSLESGRLESGELLAGTAKLRSDTLSIDGVPIALLELEAEVAAPNAISGRWRIEADEHSRFEGEGRYGLASRDYGGEAALRLDLATEGALRRLLATREIARLLPRRTEAELKIEGEAGSPGPRGELSFQASDLALAEGAAPIRSLEAEFAFADGGIGGELQMRSGPLDLDADLTWDGRRFELSRFIGSENGARRFEGSASLPLELAKLSPQDWFAQKGSLEARLQADAFPLSSLFRLVREEAPVSGELVLDFSLAGSPAAPELDLEIALRDLALTGFDQIPPAQVEVSARAKDETATLAGRLTHPDVNPLELEAELPFHPGAWARGERDPLDETLSAAAKMAPSSLDFLAARVPEIQSVAGVVGLDATLAGTPRQPALAGEGQLEVSRLRFADRNAPSVYDIDLRTSFRDDRVTLERLRAIVAGGEIEASGSLVLRGGEDPVIDLRATGREMLIYRTPDLSLRTDADLTLAGPWPRARLSGEIGIVNSGYYKVFDLLPQAIPFRRASALPTVDRAPRGGGPPVADLDLGVEIEPFRDWEIDVRLHTKEPFLVRSNLVTSDIAADLHLGGTLGRPVPRGHLAVDEGEFDLPFSSVDVEVGRVEFDETTGFDGAVEFKALARADQYRINVYLYNRILDPKYVLTSTPPLPQEDLLSLIVTGSTRSEMVGAEAGSVAASRAATLLLRNLTRARDAADHDPSLFDQLQERTELDIRGINPETGAETVGGRIRLWRQLFLVGNVDTESDYRAVLKYVFRFR